MTKNKQTDFSSGVMERLEADKVKMHPQWYFVALSASIASLVVVVSACSGLLLHALIVHVRGKNLLEYLHFGFGGYREFFYGLPWLLLGLLIILCIVVFQLLRYFDFSYRHKLSIVIGMLIGAVLVLGVGLTIAGTEQQFGKYGPLKGALYGDFLTRPGLAAGRVVNAEEDRLVIINKKDNRVIIVTNSRTLNRDVLSELEADDHVTAFGRWIDEYVIEAKALRRTKHSDIPTIIQAPSELGPRP